MFLLSPLRPAKWGQRRKYELKFSMAMKFDSASGHQTMQHNTLSFFPTLVGVAVLT